MNLAQTCDTDGKKVTATLTPEKAVEDIIIRFHLFAHGIHLNYISFSD